MFLTRIGDDTQVIINGDVSQTDLRETSGLRTVIHLVKSRMMPVPIVEFGWTTSCGRGSAPSGCGPSRKRGCVDVRGLPGREVGQAVVRQLVGD